MVNRPDLDFSFSGLKTQVLLAWQASTRTQQDMAEALGLAQPLTIGSVVASDAFFPFADGLLAAAEAGATAVIQPGGSIRDEEVIAAAKMAALRFPQSPASLT